MGRTDEGRRPTLDWRFVQNYAWKNLFTIWNFCVCMSQEDVIYVYRFVKIIFQASFLEIYNEEIKCLLTNDPGNTKYEIKMIKSDDNDKELHVTNLKVEDVTGQAQIASMIKRARKNRAWAKTLCNERSSRSHSVFMMKIMGENSATTETCCSTLNLVDLAGSERIKESGSEGQRLTEAQVSSVRSGSYIFWHI